MTFGDMLRKLSILMAVGSLAVAPQAALAQQELPTEQADVAAQAAPAQAAGELAEASAAEGEAAADAEAYEYFGPEMIKGQPTAFEDDAWASMNFQEQYSPTGDYALWMNNVILTPVVVVISLFVLGLLLYVMARYRRSANPTPSKTSHNTTIEVIWTLVPVLILVGIAIPSISLLAQQYDSPPEDALTVKVTGYQWYWGYTYVDNGGFEVISNMLDESDALAAGLPNQLAVDNRMVLPVGEEIRIQTTAADVIHAFAVPSLWYKMDAVPGRLNEKKMFIEEEGIYYGQCSELCGARHGYMPIAIEAVSRPRFEEWVRSQGGTVGDEAEETSADPAPLEEPTEEAEPTT